MTPDDDRRCDRCGGAAIPADDGDDDITVLECADCGNVIGLAQPEFDGDTKGKPKGSPVRTDTIHATDGDLDQLDRLLGTHDGDEPRVEADRLVLECETATLAVVPNGDTLEIRATEGE
jgi:hypothetical protein